MTMQRTQQQATQTATRTLRLAVSASVRQNAWKNKGMDWEAFCERLQAFHVIPLTAAELAQASKEQQFDHKDSQGAYVFGSVDESGRRSNETMQTREGLTLDLDQQDKGSIAEIISRLEASGLNFLAHSTAQHTDEQPRIRIIIPFDQPLEKEHLHEYEAIAKTIADRFLIPESDDHSSFEYSKAMFWSAHCEDVDPLLEYETQGDYLPLKPLIQQTREKGRTGQPESVLGDYRINHVWETPTLRDDYVLDAVTLYEQHEQEKLRIYDPHYLSCQQVIAKAIITGEITEESGFDAVKILAGNNEDWKLNNVLKLKAELQNCKRQDRPPTTEYTFESKFTHYLKAQEEQQQRLEYYGRLAEQDQEQHAAEPMKPRRFDRASNLQKEELPPISFVVDQMLPQGIGWLAGASKGGKSFLVMQLAYCVSQGQDFLGYPTEKSVVLYYSLEMGQNLVQDRLNTMYGNEEWSDNLIISYDLPNLDNGCIAALRQDIESTGAKLAIIDMFAFISGSKNPNKPLYEETYKEIKQLKDLADDLDITLILVTHLNKQSLQTDPFDRITGSVANRGASDFNMILAKDPETKGQRLLQLESRKSEGLDLVLKVNSRAICEKIGSPDEIQLIRKRDEYLADPVANTIKKLLLSQASASIMPSDLYDLIPDYATYEIDSVIKLGKHVNSIRSKLKEYDRITVKRKRINKGTQLIFKRPRNQISLTPITDDEP